MILFRCGIVNKHTNTNTNLNRLFQLYGHNRRSFTTPCIYKATRHVQSYIVLRRQTTLRSSGLHTNKTYTDLTHSHLELH